MKVGIGWTKTGLNAENIYKLWESGLKLNGDITCHIKNYEDISSAKDCDLVFQVAHPYLAGTEFEFCDEQWTNKKLAPSNDDTNKFRVQLYRICKKNNIRMIFLDTGVFNHERNRKQIVNCYYQIGYDSIKGLGNYYNKNSPQDRWEKLDLKIENWNLTGQHFLVMGQIRFGIGSQHLDINNWYNYVIEFLQQNTSSEHEIRVRKHPNNIGIATDRTSENFKLKLRPKIFVNNNKPLCLRDFKAIGCVITFSTNAAVISLLSGIPTICMSKASPVYPYCYRDLSTIMDKTEIPNRKQIFSDLAYTQWNIKEIESGEAWSHLKQFYSLAPLSHE